MQLINLTSPGNTAPPTSVRLLGGEALVDWDTPLADGNYRVVFDTAGLTDAAGNTVSPVAPLDFFVLAGDLDRDRDVDLTDAALLERNFGRIDNPLFSEGDIDYDGDVDLTDAALLERKFGTSLPPVDTSTASLFAGPRSSGRLIDDLL
ncbi:MAG: Ig-like domain-containing protein [Cyanobacteria bacterium P01_D01_bin.73]